MTVAPRSSSRRTAALHRLVHRRLAPRQAELGPALGGLAEAFTEHADADPFAARADGRHVVLHIIRRDHAPLARIEGVGASQHREHAGRVLNRVRHRPDVVEGHVDREAPGIGNEAEGRLVPDHAAPGGGDADRAALIAADGHGHVAGGERGGAPLRRAAGRMGGLARIAHRAVAAGVAAAGEREVGAGRLADDGGARVEQAGHDGGVDDGHVAFEGARAVHHRQTRH